MKATKQQVHQRSITGDGASHDVVIRGGMVDAVLLAIGHYTTHAHPNGGYVGVCPTADGIAVQLHAPDGSIESWRELVLG